MADSNSNNRVILFFIEDPGALVGMLPMARHLTHAGCSIYIELDGYAKNVNSLDLEGFTIESNSVENILNKKYNCVIVGSSENRESKAFQLIKICREMKITSYAFVDGPANPKHRFSGKSFDPLRFSPDFLIVVDEITAASFVQMGFSKHAILVIEHPRIDDLQRQRVKLSGKSHSDLKTLAFGESYRNCFIITFCSELSTGLNADGYQKTADYLLEAPDDIFRRTDVVVHNFITAIDELRKTGYEPKTVLRLHPKQEVTDVKLAKRFDMVSKGNDTLEVCMASDVVVGMASMILLEAFEVGTSVISLLPREKEVEWLPFSLRNKIPICTDYNEFLPQLRLAFESRPSTENGCTIHESRGKSASYVDFIVGSDLGVSC